jgi:hypothetical protein
MQDPPLPSAWPKKRGEEEADPPSRTVFPGEVAKAPKGPPPAVVRSWRQRRLRIVDTAPEKQATRPTASTRASRPPASTQATRPTASPQATRPTASPPGKQANGEHPREAGHRRAPSRRAGHAGGPGGRPPERHCEPQRSRPKGGEDRATPGGYGGKPPGVAIIGVPTGARNAGSGAPTGDQSTDMNATRKLPPMCQDPITTRSRDRAEQAESVVARGWPLGVAVVCDAVSI